MNLRPYQQDCVNNTVSGWQEFQSQLLVVPTGGGKTIIFSKLAQGEQPGRVLILCHREELIDQAIAKLHASTGIIADKEKAEWKASRNAPVVVGSVQTMMSQRRLERWPRDHFSLVICDEAHHSIADSWQRVLQHFCNARVLGVTATPDRGDKKNLGRFYQNIAHEVKLLDLIHDGYLSNIIIQSVPLKLDLNEVRKTAGDFNAEDLDDVLGPCLPQIARSIKEYAGNRRTLVFVPLIATSQAFVNACLDAGISAEHIDGTSPDRKEILERYAAGHFQVLSNAMLLTEGFDDPGIECVVVLRPTQSRPLYAQMVGRGTRIAPDKENLLLLDFLWMHEKHSLVRPASLIASSDAEAMEMTALIEAAGGEMGLEDAQGNARAQREAKLRAELEANQKRKSRLTSVEDLAAMFHQMDIVEWEPTMKWHERPMTSPQRDMLERNGVDLSGVKGRGHASQIIDFIVSRNSEGLATPKQVRMLARFGIADPEKFTRQRASEIIGSRLAKKPQPVSS